MIGARAIAPFLLLAACVGPQSALDPAGPAAQSIHLLGIVMTIGAVLVTLLVTVLMLVPFWRRRARPVSRRLFLWGGGVALPFVSLIALIPYVLHVGQATRVATEAELSVEMTGHMWWWQLSYSRSGGPVGVASANELRVPAGEPVALSLTAKDVIHSFWVPNLAGKLDMIPGRTNRMAIQADRAGIYRGQCAEYCGRQHALMAFDVIVMPREEFDAWLRKAAQPPRPPERAQLREGRDLFVSLGCGACHTVQGVSQGQLGPDLTHIGARRSLGAGALPGGMDNLAAWIKNAQHFKPGVAMPSYDQVEAPKLRALAAYLASLQ